MTSVAARSPVPERVREDLRAAAGLLRIIKGRVFVGDVDCGYRPFSIAQRRAALRAMEDAVYQHWFTRSSPPPQRSGEAYDPDVVRSIRRAHDRGLARESGWVAVRSLPGGAVVATRTGAEMHFAAGDFVNVTRPGSTSHPGDSLTVTVRRETVDEPSGWWMTWGRHGVVPEHSMLRVYWNAGASVTPLLVSGVTSVLEERHARFMMKCPTHQHLYNRTDAVVVYLDISEWAGVKDDLRGVHDRVALHLGEHVPPLTLQIGRGVSVAEDPADGRSFGQSRAAAIAAGLLRAVDVNWTDVDRITEGLIAALCEQGISARRPYLKGLAMDRDIEQW